LGGDEFHHRDAVQCPGNHQRVMDPFSRYSDRRHYWRLISCFVWRPCLGIRDRCRDRGFNLYIFKFKTELSFGRRDSCHHSAGQSSGKPMDNGFAPLFRSFFRGGGCFIGLIIDGCENQTLIFMMKTSGYLLASDQLKIHYDRYNGGHDKVIIIAHGFYNSKQAVLLMQLAADLSHEFDVIIFDFRGHGLSQGLFYWTSREYLDLLAVVALAHRYYAKIGVIGFSLGAATSIIAASKTVYIDSIIAISAPADFGKIDYKFWKVAIKDELLYTFFGKGRLGKGVRPGPFWFDKEKPLDLVKTLRTPIFYIHGNKDWVVDHWHSEKLYSHTGGFKRLNIISNGPHAEYLFKNSVHEVLKLSRSWFHETL